MPPAAPPIARGTPTALALGPGYLRIGPLDAIEPTGAWALTDTWESFDPGLDPARLHRDRIGI